MNLSNSFSFLDYVGRLCNPGGKQENQTISARKSAKPVQEMVIISAIFSISEVEVKATILLSRVPEKWYKDGPEIAKFKSDLRILSCTPSERGSELTQQAMGKDLVYNSLLAEAVRWLDAEKDFYEKHRENWTWKWRRRQFPSQLTYILSTILELAQVHPEHLARGVERQDPLTTRFLMDPLPLPCGYDLKYVPLQGMVDDVKRALEDREGPQVVTLYGAPGMGKSSLAKYVALLYQDVIRGSTPCSFDGVQYLFCGRGCRKKMNHLGKAFLLNLGMGRVTEAYGEEDGDHSVSFYQSLLRRLLDERRLLIILDDVWREDLDLLTCLISQGTESRYLLTSQSRDVWHCARCICMSNPTEEEALKILWNHLQESRRRILLKESLTSNHLRGHLRGFSSRSMIQRSPSRNEIQGPSPGGDLTFCTIYFQNFVSEIITKLGRHPLSLVNVAVSVSRDGKIDLGRWASLAQNLLIFLTLNENYNTGHILVYERPYSLSVSDSMMFMVQSLRKTEQDLFFLIALLADIWGKEPLIKFFMRRFLGDNSSESTFKYSVALSYLENNSLVSRSSRRLISSEDCVEISLEELTIHKLRKEFIRQNRLPALQSLVSNLLAPSREDHHIGGIPMNDKHSEQYLAVALGALCLDNIFIDQVALPFQSLMTQMMGEDGLPRGLQREVYSGVVKGGSLPLSLEPSSHSCAMSGVSLSRGPEPLVDARELLSGAKDLFWKIGALERLLWLLNLEGEELWKRQCRSDANKIIMKLLCKQQLDDASMASLLNIPRIADLTCTIFHMTYETIYRESLGHGHFYGRPQALSDILPATWTALSNLLYTTTVPLEALLPVENSPPESVYDFFNQVDVSTMVTANLEFELEGTILAELQKFQEVAECSSSPHFRDAVHEGFRALHDSRLTFQMLVGTDLQELLPAILWTEIHKHDMERRIKKGSIYPRAYQLIMRCVARDKGYVEMLLTVPKPWEEWFTDPFLFKRLLYLTEGLELHGSNCSQLLVLSGTPEFQARGASALREDFMVWPEARTLGTASFWAEVGLLQDHQESVRGRLVAIAEQWVGVLRRYKGGEVYHFAHNISACTCSSAERCYYHLTYHLKFLSPTQLRKVTRAVTIIDCLHGSSSLVSSCIEDTQWLESACFRRMAQKWEFYVCACWGQAQAYHKMEMYARALTYLELAEQACVAILTNLACKRSLVYLVVLKPKNALKSLRLCKILLKALWQDYRGALNSLHFYEQSMAPEAENWHNVQFLLGASRAVLLRLSGDSSKAVQSFDKSLQHWEKLFTERRYTKNCDRRVLNFLRCCVLHHRGYTLSLLGDFQGSKLDRQSIEHLRSRKLVVEPVSWDHVSNFLNFEDIEYSLLQLPVDYPPTLIDDPAQN